jgi:hypothetical protein
MGSGPVTPANFLFGMFAANLCRILSVYAVSNALL